ncbi:MAG: hypothetical protein IPL61_33550 [Myxococcales bacterium]|nr:hypothetical protein [Myxococcales bacterium]
MVDGRALLAWADLDERRRRGSRPSGALVLALLAGLGLAALALARDGWLDGARVAPGPVYLIAVALVALVPTMMMAPHRMFWRADAAMVARLPIPGGALWWVALVRAVRGAALGVVVAAPTAIVATIADAGTGARFAAVIAALAVVAAALVPAVCVGAAHVVASGQAAAATQALGGDQQVPTTTLLGALPGATIAGVVLAAAATGGWIADGAGAQGPLVLAGLALAAALAAAAATAAAPRVYPRAMREVAALDRQLLAHLEIDRATAVERAAGARLGGDASRVFDRLARLTRRRYPLFALAGAGAAIALVALGLGRPADADAWLAITAGAAAAIAATLARATGQPPLELARSSATLPLAPAAITRARRATVALWLAVWTLAPTAIAVATSPRPATTGALVAVGAAIGTALGALRRSRA